MARVNEPKGAKAAKAIAGICLALLVLLLVAFAGVNLFVRTTYAGFYQDATREFAIPGTDDGFIVQDLDELEDGTWLFSGYATSGPSPVYVRHTDGTTVKLAITRADGSTYDGHGSGITSDDEHVFLTDDEGFLVFSLTDFKQAEDDAIIQAQGRRSLEFAPAFMNIENQTLFLGTFYHPGPYEAPDHHKMDTPSGDWNAAIMYAYPADANGTFGYADQTSCAYSLPARIQGMCITETGQLVLSQSYGLASSHLLVYDLGLVAVNETVTAEAAATFTADGTDVPLFFLDSASLTEDITAPPMSEGIEWHDDKVWISCESASDKYLFGKLYGANAVYALSI